MQSRDRPQSVTLSAETGAHTPIAWLWSLFRFPLLLHALNALQQRFIGQA